MKNEKVPLSSLCAEDRRMLDAGSTEAQQLSYLSLEHVEAQTGRILKEPEDDVEDEGKSTTFYYDDRHVLYGKLRPYLNKVALPNGPGRCTTEIIPLLPVNGTSREYLSFLLRCSETVSVAMRDTTGSRMPRASMKELMKMMVPHHSPTEQRRIAGLLTAQLAAVEKARKAAAERVAAAGRLEAAILNEAYAKSEQEEWPMEELVVVSDIVSGIQKQPDRAPREFHRPFLTVRNVQRGRLDLSVIERFEITPKELERLRLEDEDILVVEGNGSVDHIGRNALFHSNGEEWIHQNHIIRVRMNRKRALPRFVSYYLNSEAGMAQMLEKAQTSSGLYTLSSGKVAKLMVPLPPIAEQKATIADIEHALAHVRSMNIAAAAEHAAIEALPGKLLGEVFG